MLRRRVAHLSRQVQNPDHPGPVDVVLLSHLHHDHFDKPSLRRLASPDTTVVLPSGTTRYLGGIKFGTVRDATAQHRVGDHARARRLEQDGGVAHPRDLHPRRARPAHPGHGQARRVSSSPLTGSIVRRDGATVPHPHGMTCGETW